MTGNIMVRHRTGNRLIGNERCAVGKSYPYLSRKINPSALPCSVFSYEASIFLQSKERDIPLSESDKTDRNKGKSKSKNKKKKQLQLGAAGLSAGGGAVGAAELFLLHCAGGPAYAVAIIVLAVFIALGIVFDMIGVAVTAADPKPFHSMAAHKEKGAKEAIRLLKNANQVSSFCNDVVGDTSAASSAVPRRLSSWWSAEGPEHHLHPHLHRRDGADLRYHHRRQGAGKDGGHQRVYRRGVPGGPAHAYPASLPMKWSDQLAVGTDT